MMFCEKPPSVSMSVRTTRLLTDWSFAQVEVGEARKIGEWLPVSSFPTTVHVELLKLGKIPDPVGFLMHRLNIML